MQVGPETGAAALGVRQPEAVVRQADGRGLSLRRMLYDSIEQEELIPVDLGPSSLGSFFCARKKERAPAERPLR